MLYTCLNNSKAQAEVLEGHKEGEVNAVLSGRTQRIVGAAVLSVPQSCKISHLRGS